LSIGSLEFEIVDTGKIATFLPADTALNTDQYQQYPALPESRKDIELESQQLDVCEKQLRQKEESLDLRTKELEEAAAALRAEQNKLEEERRQWKDLRCASLSDEARQRAVADEERLSRLKAQLAELESQRNAWTLQQQQWRAEQEASHQQLQDRERQFNKRTAELNALAAELETRQAKLDLQASNLELHNIELTDQAAELATQTVKNNAYSSELDARSAQIEARSGELQTQAAELAKRPARIDAQAAELEKHAAELKKQSDGLNTQLADLQARSAELDSQQSEFENKCSRWEALCRTREQTLSAREAKLTERESTLATSRSSTSMSAETMKIQSDELQNRLAELDSKQSALETQRNQWEESCRAKEKKLTSREEEITQKTAQLETLQAQFHAEEKQWKHQLAEWERSCERWEAERTEQNLSIEASPTGEMRAVENELSPHTEKAPAEVDDILRRFGRDIDVPEEKVNLAADAPLAQSSAEQDKKDETTAYISTQQSSANEGEESVDDYMLRLMQRIRSTQGELTHNTDKPNLPASSPSDSAPLPFETMPPVAASPILTPAQHGKPVELAPRSTAPEKEVDITMFRDLANYSAQNALGTHARGQMMRVMYSKLAVALMGGFTGIGLLLVWQLWFSNRLTFFSAMMSFVVALIWGAQYVALTIRLLASGSENPGARQTSHSKDKKLITPNDQHAISAIAGEEVSSYPESPEGEFEAKQSANASDASGKHRKY
jgi:chromosome segregation ATPase